MDKHELQKRLMSFAFRIVSLCAVLPKNPLGRYFHNQIIRSAFSAPADYRAACIAQSPASFIAKLSIAFEESDETVFWLDCIHQASFFNPGRLDALMKEALELSKILGAARK